MFRVAQLPLRNFVVIGSMALQVRECSDIDVLVNSFDILVPEEEINKSYDYIWSFQWNGIWVECHLADKNETLGEILELEVSETNYSTSLGPYMASYATQYILKSSHLTVVDHKWEQNIQDYNVIRQLFATAYAHEKPYESWETFDKLHFDYCKATKERIKNQKVISLKKTAKDFFDDKITKYIHHDRIHQWMAPDKEHPSYLKMQLPGNEVQCEKQLFWQMTEEERLNCVMEETQVIACERFLIPQLMREEVGGIHRFRPAVVRDAFRKSLKKVCTTLTSGWFRDYAIENYFEVLNFTPMDFHLKIEVEELDPSYMEKQKDEKNRNN